MSSFPKTILAALAGSAALAGAATAGGYVEPVMEPAPVVVAEPVAMPGNWAGGYTGVFLGYGMDSAAFGDDAGQDFDDDAELDGVIGGLTGGWNFQTGNWVYGVEADIAAMDQSDSIEDSLTGDEYSADLNWMATLRGRVGYDMGNWMPYATAGVAAVGAEYDVETAAGSEDDENTMTGYTVGLGAEYALSDQWSMKGEYLYTDLEGRFQRDAAPSSDVDHEMHQVRVGLNYRF